MDYYREEIFIPHVNESDEFIGPIERWEAHKKGILHRAFTIAMFINDDILLQHRRHPVFDGVYDLTCSSHPTVKNGNIQDMTDAVYETLAREWGVPHSKISPPEHKGSILYSAKDNGSVYKEHEVCHLYTVESSSLPKINYEFSYGYSLVNKKKLINQKEGKELPISHAFAPWVPKLLGLLER